MLPLIRKHVGQLTLLSDLLTRKDTDGEREPRWAYERGRERGLLIG